MSKKVSIVMPYYNRVEQLRLTLKTISESKHKDNVEIVLIDDASDKDQKAFGVLNNFDIDFIYQYNNPEEKTWKNPCHSFNQGFEKATGEIIIIQNPECFHFKDVIGFVIENTKENYLVFACKTVKDRTIYSKSKEELEHFCFQQLQSKGGWYNHHKYNPRRYHFTASISKKNLMAMGGFDQRYADGYCFDDDEFLARMQRSPFPIVDVEAEECFTVHQWHSSVLPSGGNKDEKWKRNRRLFINVTKKETDWKANNDQ